MKQLIARLRTLEAAATPRYTFDGYDIRATRYQTHHIVAQGVNLGSGGKEACEHVVEVANALPQLLDRLEKLEAENVLLRAVVEPLAGHDVQNLLNKVVYLQQTDGEGWAVGETLRRALKLLKPKDALAALEIQQ